MNVDIRGWFRAQRNVINRIVEAHNKDHPDDPIDAIDWAAEKAVHMTPNRAVDDVMDDIPEVPEA